MKYYAGRKNKKGFTLIELLVSVALFTVVMTVSIGTFLAIIDANRKTQSMKSVTNNLNFALDSMMRTIRTGIRYRCVAAGNLPNQLPLPTATGSGQTATDCSSGNTGIMLIDDRNRRVAYRYVVVGGEGRIERNVRSSTLNTGWIPLTAREVRITDFRFYVTGAQVQGDGTQPTVTMAIRGEAGTLDETDSEFNIQTTVTQRLLDE